MSLRQRLLGSSRFGHFGGAPTPAVAGSAAEGEDEAARAAKKKADEDEAAKVAEEDEARKARKARKARRARKAKKSEQPSDEDDDPDGDDAGDDEEDEDDEDEMKKAAVAGHDFALDAAFRMGARSQRRRCVAIFANKAAAVNPVLAMSLAFETTMTASAAIGVLERTPVATPSSLHARMAGSASGGVRVPPIVSESPGGAVAVEASWDRALRGFAPKS